MELQLERAKSLDGDTDLLLDDLLTPDCENKNGEGNADTGAVPEAKRGFDCRPLALTEEDQSLLRHWEVGCLDRGSEWYRVVIWPPERDGHLRSCLLRTCGNPESWKVFPLTWVGDPEDTVIKMIADPYNFECEGREEPPWLTTQKGMFLLVPAISSMGDRIVLALNVDMLFGREAAMKLLKSWGRIVLKDRMWEVETPPCKLPEPPDCFHMDYDAIIDALFRDQVI